MPLEKEQSRAQSEKEALHKTEEILKLLVDAVADYAIFAIDTKGKILTWNKGVLRLKGYTEAEFVGQNFSILYLPEDLKRGHPAEELNIALKNGRHEEQGWRVKKDGSKFWASILLTPMRDLLGNHIGFTKVTRDLTEQRRLEQKKRNEEEKFRLMVESVRDYAIFMLDVAGNVISWNEGAKRFKGYSSEEIIGQHFSKFYLIEDINAKKPQMELEIAESMGRFEDEGFRVRKDGTTFWANVIITALRDEDGKLLGFTKVTKDLTEKKRTEEELKSAYESLEERIKEKTRLLEDALKTRDEFLSIASHELKTPITSIKMQLQMAEHRINSTSGESFDVDKQKKTISITIGQVERLTLLIDDLLDISRIRAGKLNYSFELLNLSAILDEVIDGFDQQFSSCKNYVKKYVDESIEGYWDRTRLEQVLVNLIANSCKYAAGSQIVIFAKRQNDNAVISVQDFGPGIPVDYRGKIFERFERLGQSKNVAGLGLGLFISKQVVIAHGGTIELKSNDDTGATFIITLPIDSRKPKIEREKRN